VIESSFDPAAIDVSGDITLIVAHRSGRNLKGHRVAMHTDVENELRKICAATLSFLGERKPVRYASDLAFDGDNEYLLVPGGKLLAHRRKPRHGRQPLPQPGQEAPVIEVDPAARVLLAQASSLPELAASDLAKQSLLLYAAVIGNDPEDRIAFLDKWNPYKAGLSGNLVTLFGDRLRRLEGPLLVFERTFDMVVSPNAIAVLDARAFEAIFRDIDAMTERIPAWSDAAIGALPIDDASAERIRILSLRSSRVAGQLRDLYERGAFSSPFKVADLRRELKAQDLDPDRLLTQGRLTLEEDDIPVVLKLLDEKLYKGWRTGTPWDVATRSPRT
jgi:hypothetical protein